MITSMMITLQEDERIWAEVVSREAMWPQKAEASCYLGICMLIHVYLCIVEHRQNNKVKAGV